MLAPLFPFALSPAVYWEPKKPPFLFGAGCPQDKDMTIAQRRRGATTINERSDSPKLLFLQW